MEIEYIGSNTDNIEGNAILNDLLKKYKMEKKEAPKKIQSLFSAIELMVEGQDFDENDNSYLLDSPKPYDTNKGEDFIKYLPEEIDILIGAGVELKDQYFIAKNKPKLKKLLEEKMEYSHTKKYKI